MNEDWLKDIHDRMADFEMEEPAGMWEELHLNDNKVQAPKQKQTMWLLPRRLAAVAVVLVGMFAGYHFLTDISIYNNSYKIIIQSFMHNRLLFFYKILVNFYFYLFLYITKLVDYPS